MNHLKKSLLFVFVLLIALVPLALAQGNVTATEAVVADGRFDTLEAAVVAAGLADTLAGGKWTVFAPTDEAFAKLGLTPENIASKYSAAELKDILLYHVLEGTNSTADLKGMLGDVTMANGKLAGLKYYEGDIYVNDDSKVVDPNIVVKNGRIHAVDTVILPPWPRVTEEVVADGQVQGGQVQGGQVQGGQVQGGQVQGGQVQAAETETVDDAAPALVPDDSIAGIAVADGRFDTLAAAVVAADLLDDLAGGEWTAFAPTDDAFAKLGLNADNIASAFSKEELADLLLYHVMDESYSTAELKTMLGNVTMANGKLAGLKFYEDHVYVNDDAKVIDPNIITGNGTIHVVDTVIQPPWPR